MPNSPKNLRDLGGIRTVDGRKVRHGMLYRSSYLYNLSESDAEYLHDLIGLSTVVYQNRGLSYLEDQLRKLF